MNPLKVRRYKNINTHVGIIVTPYYSQVDITLLVYFYHSEHIDVCVCLYSLICYYVMSSEASPNSFCCVAIFCQHHIFDVILKQATFWLTHTTIHILIVYTCPALQHYTLYIMYVQYIAVTLGLIELLEWLPSFLITTIIIF